MEDTLAHYLSPLTPAASETARWVGGSITLTITWYPTAVPPPDAFVTSARCVILSGETVLLMSNRDGEHVIPGGRREPGESMQDAASREVWEEAGLRIWPEWQLGVLHHHHATPCPAGYRYPYPDFLQTIYAVCLTNEEPLTLQDPDGYEEHAAFVRYETLLYERRLPPTQHALLEDAIRHVR